MAVLCVGRLVVDCLAVLLVGSAAVVLVVAGELEASSAGLGDVVGVTVLVGMLLLIEVVLELLRASSLSKFIS